MTPETSVMSAADTERAFGELNTILGRLTETIAEETTRARTGRVAAMTELTEAKLELARLYSAESARVKAGVAHLSSDKVKALHERHAEFRSLLQTNMTVLATAHAVSEGILRGVSGQLARKRAPSTYGASGRANALSPKATQPLALSRTL